MDVFLMVRRKRTTIFLDAKETTTVGEIKKMIAGIIKVPPENQVLYRGAHSMEDGRVLSDYGIASSWAKPHAPAMVVLSCLDPTTGEFEPLGMTPYSSPV
ncbi:hypothetical protein HPB50_024243 [Hyalomma asiaticum]|uniref:Uncharacterized protein n=1 Tax=Hyalomma asiaticum TaxID=266040 RepID=A0ACB7TMZ9_HYAAI|nr:hypothetical protein HPB50_024243 [Hyalomma asiaticum]